jgi:hypothetical protein
MRFKFNDYFDWALFEGVNENANIVGTCPENCGLDDNANFCCTTISMYEKNGEAVYKQSQCMKTDVSEFSTGMWIDDFYFEYECQSDEESFGRSKSGASMLAAGTASLLLVLSIL